MKISSKKIISSNSIKSESDLEKAIKDALTSDICFDIVAIAYSEDDLFSEDAFIAADVFWDIHENDDLQDMCLKFFKGENLDTRGAADPSSDYFRFDGYGNVESTDTPGDIYLDELDDELTDYIMDHLDDREFPEEIQKLIDNYFENKE